ncbi:MAG: MBOAT family O-acyltransferase [Crocinitomicaceae bacterium]
MILHETLPFSNSTFFFYLAISTILVWTVKRFAPKILSFRYVLSIVIIGYIALLFTKPIQLIVLILVLYGFLILLRKYYKGENIIFPMLLLALPMFLMKYINIVPVEGQNFRIRDIRVIIQIAGLSYIVFKAISLYIDERHNSNKISLVDFFNYLTFVPTLLIGPLDRFQRFKKDTDNGYTNITKKLVYAGWEKLVLGLLFKFIIAESIRRLILSNLVDDSSILYHIQYAYIYLFYLFFDFAGYSLLAIGAGNLIGIHVPINFDKPFTAVNPKEFWKRWHKSLGDWLNDYFFKPIFKDLTSRGIFKSITRQNIALMLTFTLMGFWNGFEKHYILSGMLFGLYSVIHNYYVYRCKKTKKDVIFGKLKPTAVKVLSIFIMFNAVTFAIYIFSGNLI